MGVDVAIVTPKLIFYRLIVMVPFHFQLLSGLFISSEISNFRGEKGIKIRVRTRHIKMHTYFQF